MSRRGCIAPPEGAAYGDAMHRHLFTCRAFRHFISVYTEEYGEPAEVKAVRDFQATATTLDNGTSRPACAGWVLDNGLCAVSWTGTDRWSLYETRGRAEEREYDQQWLEYYKLRGHWTFKVPEAAGTYATRNREGVDCADRIFEAQTVGDSIVVRDTTGFCPSHKRTEWRGYFWSLPRPRLRARTEFGE